MAHLLLVNSSTGSIDNAVVWDGHQLPTAPEGYHWLEDPDQELLRHLGGIVSDDRVNLPEEHLHYRENRAANYPRVEDQLDAIYHWAQNNNHSIPGFTDILQQVKQSFPKQ